MRKFSHSKAHRWDGQHRFEHWYRDNTVYFITSKVRDGLHAFRAEDAKRIFWDRFDHYSEKYGFEPWIVSLLDNHYHVIGWLKTGENLGPLMQRLHGSVAKLVNDLLPERHLPFWRHRGAQDYFDGCLRDALQLQRAFRYTALQAVRARIVTDYRTYPHTRAFVSVEEALHRADARQSYLSEVPYQRYERRNPRKNQQDNAPVRRYDHSPANADRTARR